MTVDMFVMPSVAMTCALAGASGGAGFVDAIAGGGGLISLPVLLAAGVPAHLALGTNKGQSVFGSCASMITYARAGLVDWKQARFTWPLAFIGSTLGAFAVTAVAPATLRPVVMILLALASVLLWMPRPTALADGIALSRGRMVAISSALALVIGSYDGFFGPGTGAFLIVGMVALLGRTLPRATADAKVINFASNVAAVLWFAGHGAILWRVSLPMAGAQLLGGILGARTAIRGGARLIRVMVTVVSTLLLCKLAFDFYVSR